MALGCCDPIKRIEAILQEGAGSQWDPAVVHGLLAVRDDACALAHASLEEMSGEPGPSPAYAVGYGAFGPALLGFVQWLHRTATEQDRDHLYFLARDGHVMQRAYEAYWGEQALPTTPEQVCWSGRP